MVDSAATVELDDPTDVVVPGGGVYCHSQGTHSGQQGEDLFFLAHQTDKTHSVAITDLGSATSSLHLRRWGGDVALLIEHQTGVLLTQLQFPGAARDFPPRVNFQLITMLLGN